MTANAPGAISDAVANAQSTWDNVTSWLNSDDLLGTKVFTFGHDTLAADAFHDMRQRWTQTSTTQQGQLVVLNDWEIFGEIQGIQPCPVAASVSVLQAQGLLTEADAREVTANANEFRRRLFAGDRDLGAWWALAERNTAAIAGVLHANPDDVRKFGGAAVGELAAALVGNAPLSDDFVTRASALLQLLADKGPPRLRIDAKAALGILPFLQGKTPGDALDVLRQHAPTRKPSRLPRRVNNISRTP